MRGIRGAITVQENSREAILTATRELLERVMEENEVREEELVSIVFTATPDLDQVYPAVAAREMGLQLVPLQCYQEMSVINSLKKCIRVLVYINRDCSLKDIRHVYLEGAKKLRPDLV
ncbi:MAG: chorismate mutase [Halanaerobiales bacterium]|nr:chorismate mutase [Halanaerobiales bacterium]